MVWNCFSNVSVFSVNVKWKKNWINSCFGVDESSIIIIERLIMVCSIVLVLLLCFVV